MRNQYYRDGEGFLLMYAITVGSSLEEMQQYARDVLSTRYLGQRRRRRGEGGGMGASGEGKWPDAV